MKTYVYRNLKIKSRFVWKTSDIPKSRASNPQVDSVTLRNVTFHINAANQRSMEKSIRLTGTLHRLVGAWAVGDECEGVPSSIRESTPITYNPGRGAFFTNAETGKPISYCEYVEFTPSGAFAKGSVTYA